MIDRQFFMRYSLLTMKKSSPLLTEEKARNIIREEFHMEFHKEFQIVKQDLVDKETFSEKVTKFKDEILTMLDKVMKELKDFREEQTIHSGYNDQIEDHETRIGKLEEVLSP